MESLKKATIPKHWIFSDICFGSIKYEGSTSLVWEETRHPDTQIIPLLSHDWNWHILIEIDIAWLKLTWLSPLWSIEPLQLLSILLCLGLFTLLHPRSSLSSFIPSALLIESIFSNHNNTCYAWQPAVFELEVLLMDGYGLDFSLRSLLRFNLSSLTFLHALVCALEILFSTLEFDATGLLTFSSTALLPATDEFANFISFCLCFINS